MSYILVSIPEDGMIRADSRWRDVVHKQSININDWDGVRVFSRLDAAKSEWSGPQSDEAILGLDDVGAGKEIWMAEAQTEKLVSRVKKWSGCYGAWPVKKLNA